MAITIIEFHWALYRAPNWDLFWCIVTGESDLNMNKSSVSFLHAISSWQAPSCLVARSNVLP